MATIESVIALRDTITATLAGVSNAAVQAAEDMNKLGQTAVSELVTASGITSVSSVGNAAAQAAEDMNRLSQTAVAELVTASGVTSVSNVGSAAAQAAEDMNKLGQTAVTELVTASGVNSVSSVGSAAAQAAEDMNRLGQTSVTELVTASGVTSVSSIGNAAAQAAEDMNKLSQTAVTELVTASTITSISNVGNAAAQAATEMVKLEGSTANELIGVEDVKRMELLVQQAQLMEARWINQQSLVQKLEAQYNSVVMSMGLGSAEAQKLDEALLRAQMQENRMALQAVKVADAITNQEKKATNVENTINKQVLETQKMWAAQQKIETEMQKTALMEQKVLREAEGINTAIQKTALLEQKVLTEIEKANSEKLKQEKIQQQINKEQEQFNQTAQQSHGQLLNIFAAVNLIKTGIQALTGLLSGADVYRDINARMGLINDGLMSQQQLQSAIYQAARNSLSAYADIASTVNRIEWNTPGLFQDNQSAVNFAELATKAMKMGSPSKSDNASALTHVLQGFEAGGLEGRNFTTLFRSASGQAFLRYVSSGLEVSMGKLKDMAEEGKLTAVVVAEALSKSSEKVNQDFAKLPTTFGDNMTQMKNTFMNWVDSLNQAGAPLDVINQKIRQFTDWLNDVGGQQFFNDLTQGVVFASSVIMPVVDNVAFQIERLYNLTDDPGSQAFFQSLGMYAQTAGEIINGIVSGVGAVSGFIINQWPMIEPIVLGIVGALVLWHVATLALNVVQGIQNALEIASAGIKAAKTGVALAATSATAAETAAQWGLNAALLACPITWIVLAIGALIAIIAVAVRWVMKLWDTNDDFVLAILNHYCYMMNFFNTVPVFFANVWNAIATHFENGKSAALIIMEQLVNGVIDGVNWLIEKLNNIPGVEIEAVGKVSWAAEDMLKSQAKQQSRAADIAEMITENERKSAIREQAVTKYMENRAAKRAAALVEEEQKNASDLEDSQKYYPNDGQIKTNPDYGADFNIGSVGSVGKIKESVDISSEDLKYLRDIAERDTINQFTHNTLVPKIQVTFGDVRETADVEQVYRRVTQMAVEELAVMAEGVHE